MTEASNCKPFYYRVSYTQRCILYNNNPYTGYSKLHAQEAALTS